MDASDGNGICFPYDVLLDVLRRLPRRALARSRCVCRAWCAIVDAHGLLLPYAFPRDEFPGVYATYHHFPSRSAFFARPTTPPGVEPAARFRCPFAWKDTALDPYVWTDWAYVQQHCNGLLLVRDRYTFDFNSDAYVHVCNPARMWRARLPRPPSPWPRGAEGMFLAFDPAVSRHYEVFLIPEKRMPSQGMTPKMNAMPLLVFSSQTGRWENQQFAPGHCAPGDLYDVVTAPRGVGKRIWSAEYWRRSLYVHCHSGILLILRCAERTYDMVKLPDDPAAYADDETQKHTWKLPRRSVLASYERGVRYVTLNELRLTVWTLEEPKSTEGQLGWALAHEADLRPWHDTLVNYVRTVKPTLKMVWEVAETREEPIGLSEYSENEKIVGDDGIGEEDEDDDGVEELGSGVDSEEQHFIDLDENTVAEPDTPELSCRIIGFHPHKNELLLHFKSAVLACHLDTLRMQYLGDIYPKKLNRRYGDIHGAFPYCPCYFNALPAK